MASYQKY